MALASKTTPANTNGSAGGEFKITFYSTSPKDESKSKYPIQTKTSYTVPDNGCGDTEINFGKSMAANPRTPKTRITGFRPEIRKRDDQKDQKKDSKKRNTLDTNPSDPDPSSDEPQPVFVRSRSGRVSKKPQRYEPVETVTDDFDDNDYDSDDSFEN